MMDIAILIFTIVNIIIRVNHAITTDKIVSKIIEVYKCVVLCERPTNGWRILVKMSGLVVG